MFAKLLFLLNATISRSVDSSQGTQLFALFHHASFVCYVHMMRQRCIQDEYNLRLLTIQPAIQNQTMASKTIDTIHTQVRAHVHELSACRKWAHIYRLVHVYVLQRLIDKWLICRRRKVTFWRRNLCCMSFHYYLLNCENDLSRTYQSRNYRWKLKLSWNFICKSIYFVRIFRFNYCQIIYFCPNTGM